MIIRILISNSNSACGRGALEGFVAVIAVEVKW